MRIRLAPLWKSANQLLSTHFKNTGGIQATPVFDGKNARVCITAKLSGFTMLLLKVVMELGVHVFKVHEEAELPGISEEDLQELASKAQSDIVSYLDSSVPFFSGILSLGWLPCPPARTFCVAPSFLEADIFDLFLPRTHTGGCVDLPSTQWPCCPTGSLGCVRLDHTLHDLEGYDAPSTRHSLWYLWPPSGGGTAFLHLEYSSVRGRCLQSKAT